MSHIIHNNISSIFKIDTLRNFFSKIFPCQNSNESTDSDLAIATSGEEASTSPKAPTSDTKELPTKISEAKSTEIQLSDPSKQINELNEDENKDFGLDFPNFVSEATALLEKTEEILPDSNELKPMLNDGNCSLRVLRLVLKKTGLHKLFDENVPDPRRGKCQYSVASLLMMPVMMFVLRFPSRNGFHDQGNLSEKFKENMAKLAGTTSMPCAKTFEDLFLQLDYHTLEPILPALFRFLLRNKFFELHPEFKSKITGNSKKSPFLFGIDGQVSHTYGDHSQHPCESCPFCLKRSRGKAVWYIHYDVVLSVIGENGFQMPLFFYRVRKQQEAASTSTSEDALKQECELLALPHLLAALRREFPRLPATLLLDSLYSNGPAMGLAKQYFCGFSIIRKDGSLSSLNSDIEGQKKLISPIHRNVIDGRWEKNQEVYIFPEMSHQDHTFTIVDLAENCQKVASKRFAKVTEKTTHWQWIVSENVNGEKVFETIHGSRLRWLQEDFFNTVQYRGYNLLHDFSRHPASQMIWLLLMFIATAISMLIELSRLGRLSRGSVAIINWIANLKALLIATSLDLNEPLPKQLRFWTDTS